MSGLPSERRREQEQLGQDELAGRIVEVVGTHARTTFAVELVRRAQARGELVAWLELAPGSLFPPDLEASGVLLSGLVCLRLARSRDMGQAADLLLRSGAFALVVLDLPAGASLTDASLGRLGGLLRKYHATLLCLPVAKRAVAEEEDQAQAGLSSLVSLRFSVAYHALGGGQFELVATVSKDKRHAPGRVLRWQCQGPEGLWLPPESA